MKSGPLFCLCLEALRRKLPPAEWGPPVSAEMAELTEEPPCPKKARKRIDLGQLTLAEVTTLTELAHSCEVLGSSLSEVIGSGVNTTAESTRTPVSTPQSIEQQCDLTEG